MASSQLIRLIPELVKIYVECLVLLAYLIWVPFWKLARLFFPPEPKSLDGEVILITGTANGIGKQLALQLAQKGSNAKFICVDVETKANESTVAELKERFGVKVAYAFTADLSNRNNVVKLCQQIRNEIGTVTVIVNNAGTSYSGPFLIQKPEHVVRTFDVNLFAQFWIIQEFLPEMIRQNHGHILTTASLTSYYPTRDFAVYTASKHAIHGFLEALREEIRMHPSKPTNISFTTAYPGLVDTRLSMAVKYMAKYPSLLPKPIAPEQLAQKVVDGFLRNEPYVIVPNVGKIVIWLVRVLPLEIWNQLNSGLLNLEVEHPTVNQNELQIYNDLGIETSNPGTTTW